MSMGGRKSAIGEDIRQTKPFASRAQEVTVALLRTSDVVRRRLAQVVETEGVTFQQYNVLRILRGARGESLSALQIGDRLIEQTPGVSRLLERLVAKKLIRRDRSAVDRRMIECSITAKGLEVLARLDQAVTRADEAAVNMLTARELDMLADVLERIRQPPG
jgi:DNA-binding MarR family transcriptional regulator